MNKSKEAEILRQSVPKIFNLNNAIGIAKQNDSVFLNGTVYSGYLYELHPNNSDTLNIQCYKNGVQDGTQIVWFANKKLMEHRIYTNGKKNGKQIAFWENGIKKFEFTAKNDVYEGELKEWNIDGNLIHLANYKNGQEDGAQKLWYDNGKIRANYVIIKGKRYGLLGTKNCRNVTDSIFNVK